MKRLFALLAAAALAVTLSAVAGARSTSAPTMSPGYLTVGFGDPAVNFANGKVRVKGNDEATVTVAQLGQMALRSKGGPIIGHGSFAVSRLLSV